jgi:hypothetical protein
MDIVKVFREQVERGSTPRYSECREMLEAYDNLYDGYRNLWLKISCETQEEAEHAND